MPSANDPRAPMPSAPMKYREDGSVDWATMWQTFCALALDGGPPHRGELLPAPERVDSDSAAYRAIAGEICRGVREVSGLEAVPADPGWVAIRCHSPTMARWLAEAIVAENVTARAAGRLLFVPCSEQYSLTAEVKNVITSVAKTTHYWTAHLPTEVKTSLAFQGWLGGLFRRFRR